MNIHQRSRGVPSSSGSPASPNILIVWVYAEDKDVAVGQEELDSIDEEILPTLPLGTFAIFLQDGRAVYGTSKCVIGLEMVKEVSIEHMLSLG